LEILNIIGVEYETAINGLDGVKIVERYLQRGKMFDIILMDLIMPTMDGYQASSEIRELEKKYNVNSNDRLFICGYTSLLNLEVERKCLERGMDDVVAKPINISALERMLSRNDRRK
jgi:CheY-like chemotaxis protein